MNPPTVVAVTLGRRNITLVTIHLGIVTHILLGTIPTDTIIRHIIHLNLITTHPQDPTDVITIVKLFTIINTITLGNINLLLHSVKLLGTIAHPITKRYRVLSSKNSLLIAWTN